MMNAGVTSSSVFCVLVFVNFKGFKLCSCGNHHQLVCSLMERKLRYSLKAVGLFLSRLRSSFLKQELLEVFHICYDA